MVRLPCLLLLLFLLALPVAAQTPSSGDITVSLSSDKIALDETATLTISVSGTSDDIDVPQPETLDNGLRFDYSGQRKSFSSINGNLSSSVEVDYKITPLRTGRHLIQPITGTAAGVPFTTSTQRLEVTDAGTGVGTGNAWDPRNRRVNPNPNPWALPNPNPWGLPNSTNTWPPQPDFPEPEEDDVVLEAVMEPAVVYKHQPTFYNLRLLLTGRLMSDPRYNPMAPTGFLRLAFPQENSQEERNGRLYNVMSVKTAYFPVNEGEYTFDPSQVAVSGGLFAVPETLKTEAKTVKVLPWPSEGRPQSFTGAVGQQFEIRANLKSPEIALGGNTELEVTVKGDGHLDLVPYPFLPGWANIEKKQLSSPATTKVELGQIVSQRTYNYRLKPTKVGSYDLSGIALGYFNPIEQRYEVIKTPGLTLTVEPNKNAPTEEAAGANEVAESDRPRQSAGPSQGRLPELPLGALAVGLGLLLAGAVAALPGRRTLWSPKGRPKTISARHKTLPDLMAAIETLAPGADTASRETYLRSQGWSPQSIAKLEGLKRAASRAVFGGGAEAGEQVLGDLNKQLGELLKENKR